MKFFAKLARGANKFFAKVGHDAPKILGKISQVASTAGRVLDGVASNPITMALAPELAAPAMIAGSVAHQVGGLTNASNYKGNVNQVSQNILERAQNINSTANQPPAIQFH